MARNARRNENNVFKYPTIFDIEINRLKTVINFNSEPKQNQNQKPKVFKRKEIEQAENNPDQPQEDDGTEASGAKS